MSLEHRFLRRAFRRLLLVKEIHSKTGVLHFQRYRLFQTPLVSLYVHRISESDKDADFHTHPWSFISVLLFGSYHEEYSLHPLHVTAHGRDVRPFRPIAHNRGDAHQLTLLTPVVWSLVLTGRHTGNDRGGSGWGYIVRNPVNGVGTPWTWVDKDEYRRKKNGATT